MKFFVNFAQKNFDGGTEKSRTSILLFSIEYLLQRSWYENAYNCPRSQIYMCRGRKVCVVFFFQNLSNLLLHLVCGYFSHRGPVGKASPWHTQ